ncbi:MAG TPA: hypothetical protein VJ973_06785 [Christiangramia sp.]|nr:hypothetical protein [Christiangramia sp.]
MKPKFLIPALVTGFAAGTALVYAFFQRPKKIDLTVDTVNINKSNIEDTTFFGECKTIKNKDYTTCVKPGENIKWKVHRLDKKGPKVKFSKFEHVDGKKFFGTNKPKPNKDEMDGTISSNPGNIGDVEKYSLIIEVKCPEGDKSNLFTVDPKLLLIQR